MKTTETLIFMRNATLEENGRTGVIYFHQWATGNQELIFDDHDSAARFKKHFGVKYEKVTKCEHSMVMMDNEAPYGTDTCRFCGEKG